MTSGVPASGGVAPSPNTPPRDEPGRGFVYAGAAVLALVGLVYLPGGLLLGAVLGTGFQLDPSSPWLLGLVGNGLAAVVFAAGGALLALLCAVGAGAAVGRAPWAPWVLGLAGAAMLITANLPLALVAFGLAYVSATEDVRVPRAVAPGRSDTA